MVRTELASYKRFEAFIADMGGTYVFDGETALKGIGALIEVIREMGFDPLKTEAFKQGLLSLFNVEIIGLPDLDQHRFILAPNHVSDLDAVILGLLHPRIRIVSKNAWTDNAAIGEFLNRHYDLFGLDRASLQSLRRLMSDAVDYFNGSDENRHYLVFSQGTISDFNHNSPERISTIAHKIAARTGVAILPVFIEQVSLNHPTRIVFDTPLQLRRGDDFRTLWLERQAAMQAELSPPARAPMLSDKHRNNNKPGDLFF